jgi:acetoacetyl-CoA synthetase
MSVSAATEPAGPLWVPTEQAVENARLTAFCRWLDTERGLSFDSYQDLWRWSTEQLDEFWLAVWEFFDIDADVVPTVALAEECMPGARWFPDVHLNYAEHALRHATADRPAIVAASEGVPPYEVSWAQLREDVARFAAWLREWGVRPGEYVVGVLPNVPQAVVAFLGCAAIGAVWACCDPAFGARGIVDRFAQLKPVLLVASSGYRFGGATHDRGAQLQELRAHLPGLRATVVVDYPAAGDAAIEGTVRWKDIQRGPAPELTFAAVEGDHPLWVLFSSGTTGLPKGIIHSHVGIVLEHLKVLAFHHDLRPDDRFFWYTSTSWMMWNYLVGGLLQGSTIVTYDGNPTWPAAGALFDLVEPCGITVFGTSAAYLAGCERAGVEPDDGALRLLRSVGSTGSPLAPHTSEWARVVLGPDIPVHPASGGTDVASAFVAGCPLLPVHAGEISGRALGVAVDSWDENGRSLVGEVGELVVCRPMPSMPLRMWADQDGSRYRETYFDTYPGVWRHGDWITLTDRGSAIVHGRSDSTLNRYGVRLGTSEIYQVVDRMPEIAESLVIGLEERDGSYHIVLFVQLVENAALGGELDKRIRDEVRRHASPRHVPDEIVAVPGIPHTRTGKKLEVPIKRLIQGYTTGTAVNLAAVDDPSLIDSYLAWARERTSA